MRKLWARLSKIEARDVLLLIGLVLLGVGLEQLRPGIGLAAVGAVLVGVAIWVQ